jgi:steroid delta-isomerase-like uncharacterized protein
MSEFNKALIRGAFERINNHDISVVAELYPTCVYRSPLTGELRGEAFRKLVTSVLAAFPDARWTVEEQLAEADNVVTRWTLTGTHKEEFMGIARTGKRVTITGVTIDRIVGGKIVEENEEFDALGMMRQLGVIPEAAKLKAVAA